MTPMCEGCVGLRRERKAGTKSSVVPHLVHHFIGDWQTFLLRALIGCRQPSLSAFEKVKAVSRFDRVAAKLRANLKLLYIRRGCYRVTGTIRALAQDKSELLRNPNRHNSIASSPHSDEK